MLKFKDRSKLGFKKPDCMLRLGSLGPFHCCSRVNRAIALLFFHSPISLAPTETPNEGEPKMDQVNHEGEEELGCRSHGRSDLLGEPERLSDQGERGRAAVEICMKIEKAAT